MAEKVFVSPGVYTSEKDLTFVTRQIGVTTLGLVGETTKGPAFQPIFISNYGEFQSFFGGLNNTLVNGPDGNGAPQYELPYIAKSYLSQSNQLFVTRVLGFSGYKAGNAWGITLDAALDTTTISATTANVDPLVAFTATTGGTLLSVYSTDSLFNEVYTSSAISFTFLATMTSGQTLEVSSDYVKIGDTFTAATFTFYCTGAGNTPYVLNESTSGVTAGPVNNASLFNVNLNTGTSVSTATTTDGYIQAYIDQFSGLPMSLSLNVGATGSYFPVGVDFVNNNGANSTFSAFSTDYICTSSAATGPNIITYYFSGSVTHYSAATQPYYITGTTSGNTTLETGVGYTDVENKLVALLRSRGSIDATTQIPKFQVSGSSGLVFNPTISGAVDNPIAEFSLSGNSTTQGIFGYTCSFDNTQKSYLPRVLGRTAQDGKTAIFVEEFYEKMFKSYLDSNKIRGINLSVINYSDEYNDYLCEYQPAVTPYVVSELRGNKVLRLFRFWTISDGNAANEQFKISIVNIRPDTREFDVYIRAFYDTDTQPTILESFSRCTLDPTSNNYIARRIGTLDGTYASKSTYVLLEMDESSDTTDAFPSGFVGYPIRDYQLNSNTSVQDPTIMYKTSYGTFENKRKFYLGLSNTIGIDADFFDYKGIPSAQIYDQWTGLTSGFHMDINASGATIDSVKVVIDSSGTTYSPVFSFETGDWSFTTEDGLVGGPYEKVFARKFTFAPYGGFDGWDIYRTRRSNLNSFLINQSKGQAGLNSEVFVEKVLSNGDLGITSDYYAYLEAIWTFKNPEAVNINVFATPGIDTTDNNNLVEETIEMIEQNRADSLYIVTTPDTDNAGSVLSVEDVTDSLDGLYDSNYTATYWPWIQILDAENNVYIYVPPTRDVVRNIALTDNISFPWFAVAGIQRGDVDAIKARKKLTLGERDVLYENRVNPIATFSSDGVKIWGNKTLQVKDTALNRINVRRLLLQARKLISAVAIRLLFEQNDTIVRNQFLSLVNPILDSIRTERGLTDFRVVLSNDPEEIDRNELRGKVYLKPTRSLEFIEIEFNIMNTGASFDNI
jgi:hypothetical protein